MTKNNHVTIKESNQMLESEHTCEKVKKKIIFILQI